MAQNILKEIGISKDKIEPDAISDFSFFLGDLNFRINRTFEEHEPDLLQSAQLFT